MAKKKTAAEKKSFRKDIRSEFRKQALTGITAAFAFLIALTWREPIEAAVRAMLAAFKLASEGIYYQFVTAVLVTVIAAGALVFLARWAAKND